MGSENMDGQQTCQLGEYLRAGNMEEFHAPEHFLFYSNQMFLAYRNLPIRDTLHNRSAPYGQRKLSASKNFLRNENWTIFQGATAIFLTKCNIFLHNFTKISRARLIIVRFSIRNDHWKARNLPYHFQLSDHLLQSRSVPLFSRLPQSI